ncbi:glycoside hydrolase family 113 [Mastigocoleus testarum]|uniref:CBM2 domain-containing protein n=1 Tax=Mastigocoleus testarum BC008 TaxID=371196 RepID=A0A0V7ZVB9_9CYAN|nr:cellulose binding domain-containing protein [Mastigocoleus testarum]KST68505.1 hypothetical protein BC008_01150 [Mastigocoleus testarum BC008]
MWEFAGFNYPSWWNGKFASPESTKALKQLKATGADSATIVATSFLDTTESSKIVSKQSTESLENVEKAIVDAKNQGLSVLLKPHVDLSNGQWRGSLDPTDRKAFFDNYKDLILDYAKLAQKHDAKALVIGTELVKLTGEADKDAWLDIIKEVRQVYDGKLTYAANWDNIENISFAEGLDFVGVDAYFPLTANKDASVDELVQTWTSTPEIEDIKQLTNGQSIVDWLEQVSTDYGKPIAFTEIGYRSLDGTAAKPYEFQGGGKIDFEEQSRLYEAVFKVFGGDVPEAGNVDWFKGAQFWNWYATESQNNDPTDLDYPILGKPSELIFKEYSAQLTDGNPDGGNGNPTDPTGGGTDPVIGDVDFSVGNEWNAGFTGNIEITNTGDTAINGWKLEFDAPFEVNSIWGGKITSHEGNRYEITNVDWDGVIAAGESIKLGFNGSNSDNMDLALSNVELNDVLIATTDQTSNSAMV